MNTKHLYFIINTLLLYTFTTVILFLFFGGRADASAASCPESSMRWSSSSNILYITGPNTICTPADINVFHNTRMQTVGDKTYLLTVNLKIQQGATLDVTGGLAADATTNELRLLSNNNSTINNFVNITAEHGNLKFLDTKVTSWDSIAATPDTEYGSTYKRAFIKVRSSFANGIASTSRTGCLSSFSQCHYPNRTKNIPHK
jgi:hypothetical protein